MKIAVFGIIPFTDLIKEGFIKLGHEISNNNPDLIFANDPMGYQDAVFLKMQYPKTQVILNVLDVPLHFRDIEKQFKTMNKRFFSKAENITAISFKVKKDLGKFFDTKIHEKIKVIYNPIQNVNYDKKIKKNNSFLYVGRANDPIKRFNLVRESLSKIKDGNKNIVVCGVENPNFGNYLGHVSNEKLNILYNESKFLFLPSKAEGIGLPMIESLICGTIPIACSDNETAKEFLPKEFMCDPNPESIVEYIDKMDKNYQQYRDLALKLGAKYKEQFDKVNVAKNILSLQK
ncbi:glycosyltransferase family 4 protein [Pelagibacteraceae bacterium]|nr:glycosyltransferase family 4 protein [Pelagibacteraceae bacterium]